jgi:hypothetical protein
VRDIIFIVRKFIQKIKVLQLTRQNPLVLLVEIIGSHHKELGNGQGAQIFQKSRGGAEGTYDEGV